MSTMVNYATPDIEAAKKELEAAENFFNWAYSELEFNLAIAKLLKAEAMMTLVLADARHELKTVQLPWVKEQIAEIKKKRGVA